jgi:short-subunit dehydrogenase
MSQAHDGAVQRPPDGAAAPRALVTGASRGIGKAIAARLARAGYAVTGTTRDVSALPAEARLEGVRYLSLDLRNSRSIQALAAQVGAVDVLVNNAGMSQIGPIEEVPLDMVRGIFETNFFGPLALTQLVIPGMRARRSGAIVNIASFAGVTPVPFISMYAATKSALIAASRSLRHELRPWGIRVAVIAPFDIHTDIPLEIGFGEGSAYLEAARTVKAHRDKGLAEAPGPDIVARKVLAVLGARRPRLLNVAGRGAGMTSVLVRLLPERVTENAVRSRYGL